jgi:hypothetical protein
MKFKVGELVVPNMGPYRGLLGRVLEVDTRGAANGWFTVEFVGGTLCLFAGEELRKPIKGMAYEEWTGRPRPPLTLGQIVEHTAKTLEVKDEA